MSKHRASLPSSLITWSTPIVTTAASLPSSSGNCNAKLSSNFGSYDHFWSSLHSSIQRTTIARFPQRLLMVFGVTVGLSPTLSSHSLIMATLCWDWLASCFACIQTQKPTANLLSYNPCCSPHPGPLRVISECRLICPSMQSLTAMATLPSISMPWIIQACHLWRHALHLMPSNPWFPQASTFPTISTANTITPASYLARALSTWMVYALNSMPTRTPTSLATILASSSSTMVILMYGPFFHSNLYHSFAWPTI